MSCNTGSELASKLASPVRAPLPAPSPQQARFEPYGVSTPAFSLSGLTAWCRLVDVHDGDTVAVIVEYHPERFSKFSLRLAGIDTAEMTAHDSGLKARAVAARDRVLQLCTGDPVGTTYGDRKDVHARLASAVVMVQARCLANDKYGRTLAEVWAATTTTAPTSPSIAEVLLSDRLAVPYAGQARV
jgi:endonuclease YncB( thermonuclease family)